MRDERPYPSRITHRHRSHAVIAAFAITVAMTLAVTTDASARRRAPIAAQEEGEPKPRPATPPAPSSTPPPAAPSAPAPEPTPTAPPAAAHVAGEAASSTGSLSEEEFKALHELRTDAAPPLSGEMIDLDGARAYLSLPKDAKPPLPGVTVIHELWGLNEHVKHWADRLAQDGYAALAVDLYGGMVATDRDAAMKAMKAVDEQRATEVLLAAHRRLANDPRIGATRRGSIGWCFGGGMSLRLAMSARDLDAAVLYYGRPVNDVAALKSIHASLLGIFGNQDRSIPPELLDQFDKALTEAGVRHRILRYDAGHAFANPSNPNYDQPAATAAWGEVRAFLEKELKAPAAP